MVSFCGLKWYRYTLMILIESYYTFLETYSPSIQSFFARTTWYSCSAYVTVPPRSVFSRGLSLFLKKVVIISAWMVLYLYFWCVGSISCQVYILPQFQLQRLSLLVYVSGFGPLAWRSGHCLSLYSYVCHLLSVSRLRNGSRWRWFFLSYSAAVYVIPIGMIQAVTNRQVGLK